MNYQEFMQIIKETVEMIAPEGTNVSINHVIKNNGKEMDGLSIMEKNYNIAPSIYLDRYYKQALEGRNISDIAQEILAIHNDNKDNFSFDCDRFADYKSIKNRIAYKLINYERNQKLLQDIPYIKIMDLALVFYCIYSQEAGSSASVLIKNSHLEMWDIDINTLHQDAKNNTPKLLESIVRPMSSMMHDIAGRMCHDGLELDEEAKNIIDFVDDYDSALSECREDDMYILTNKTMINGACTMIYEGVLDNLAAQLNKDLYILPSSIHELIVIPKKSNLEEDDLKSMVWQVNREGVSKDEVLSDSVYYYSSGTKQLCTI